MKTMLSVWVAFGCGLVFCVASVRASTTTGGAVEVASNVVHPDGNIYDQVLLQGPVGTVSADPGQMTRVSFLDLTGDIVQVEFSGKGAMTISLQNASGPMAPANYNQPGVLYMRGHASISISGTDVTSNLSIFSVGRITAVNQALFRGDVAYDGFADLALIEIVAERNSPDGAASFGSIHAGNVRLFATQGLTGIYAPGVSIYGPVFVGDLSASDGAFPVLSVGNRSQLVTLVVAGGDLFQPNGQSILVTGFGVIGISAGTNSQGTYLPVPSSLSRIELVGAPPLFIYPYPQATSTATSIAVAVAAAIGSVATQSTSSSAAVSAAAPVPVNVPSVIAPVDPSLVNPAGG